MTFRRRGKPSFLSTVLFDLDGTLLDSFNARLGALQRVFTWAGILHPNAEQFLWNSQGVEMEEALSQLEVSQRIATNLFEGYRRIYWTKEPGLIRLYPGIQLALVELHSRGVKLGVVTQKRRAFEIKGQCVGALEELAEVGIAGLFSVIVGFEDVNYPKPHPDGVNLALNRLAARPHETLVVGDSAADIEAARAAGCWSCYATWGIPNVEHRLGSIQADLVAEMPQVLLELTFL